MTRRDLTSEERAQIKRVLDQAGNVNELTAEEIAEINRICAGTEGDPRAELTNFIGLLAKTTAETLSLGKLTDDNKEVLDFVLRQLVRFAAKIKEPPVYLTMDQLTSHLRAAFLVGSWAKESDVRLVRQAEINAKMARVRQASAPQSQLKDEIIVELGQPIWSLHPRYKSERISREIMDGVNNQLQERGIREMKIDAIRKRVSKLRTAG
jgi:hypothetical protein